MQSTSRTHDQQRRWPIILDGIREHRLGIAAWVLGGGVFNVFETYALHVEFRDFEGGPLALAASVLPAAEAMRPLRWPADRLDTLGGYLTYHNILLFQGFLAIYAAVQGVHMIRRPEERHSLEYILTAGKTRVAYFVDRTIGMLVTLVLIAGGLAASTAAVLAYVGESNTGASFTSYLAVGLCAIVALAVGALAGQLVAHTRTGIGTAVVPLVIVYIITNEWQNVGWLGVLRFVSPFYYANDGRALVPGLEVQWTSLLVLSIAAVALLAGAAVAFARRDYAGALMNRPARASAATPRFKDPQSWWLQRIWRAQLVRHRVVLLTWSLTTAGFSMLWMLLEPTVARSWAMSGFFTMFLGGPAGVPVATMYVSFGCDVLAPIVLAYAVSQASGWVSDLHERRVEVLLTTPLSWQRLMSERLLATCVAVAVVTTSWVGTGIAMAGVVDASIQTAGYARTFVLCLLLGWAGAAIAAILAAWTRSGFAITGVIIYIVLAYMLGWFVTVFDWPVWLNRLSIFDAYAHPYLEWPDTSNLVILAGVGIVGSVLAAWIAELTPKVAT